MGFSHLLFIIVYSNASFNTSRFNSSISPLSIKSSCA
nr:MAG TPA: hypothetical protein [Caudoviricetes sp.]